MGGLRPASETRVLASRVRLITRGGYYVRSLARDLGRALGCGAHLSELRRTAIGPWDDPDPDRSIEVRGRDLRNSDQPS